MDVLEHGLQSPFANYLDIEHGLSFARQAGGEYMVCGPVTTGGGFWGDTRIALPEALGAREFTDLLNPPFSDQGDALACGDLYARFPVAVLAGI
jgi:maltooligosyltrehalose synthase